MSKRGLGRGLSALIPSAAQESHSGEDVTELPIDQIAPNPDQPRTDIDEQGIADLADSISKVGLLQPILVRPVGEGYEIIAGERRWRACREAGIERIPVRVRTADKAESLRYALIENLLRDDLNAIEESRGYRRLLQEHQMTQAELASQMSKSRSAITNSLRLLDLPEEVQELVYDGKLTGGHARAILAVPEEDARIRLGAKVADEGLSVREVENLARLIAAGGGTREARPPAPKTYKVVARKLRRFFGTNVRVRTTKDKNKIEIEFRDETELERIFTLMTDGPEIAEGE